MPEISAEGFGGGGGVVGFGQRPAAGAEARRVGCVGGRGCGGGGDGGGVPGGTVDEERPGGAKR